MCASFHCSAKIVSRSGGRSAVASAAYRACARIACERDGLVHDYTRKSGLAFSEVLIPENAPRSFLDRSTLWNEVERAERSESAQLAREIEYALPVELDRDRQIDLAREFARSFVARGMCADVCIHDTGEGNPHVHMLLTMRPVGEGGFLPKSENVYLCRNAEGEESLLNAAAFKDAKGDGFEKVYRYRSHGELTKSEAAALGLDPVKDRVGKSPVQQTRYLVDWNDRGNVEEWRAELSAMQNAYLKRAGAAARVDHRSFERRGIDMIPQRHEGPSVTAMERKARREAERKGVEYAPVTEARRENAAVAVLNAAASRMRAAVEAAREAVSTSKLASRLHAEMQAWAERVVPAAARLFQMHLPSRKAPGDERVRRAWERADRERVEKFRDRIMSRARETARGRGLRGVPELTERERRFLSPQQRTRYDRAYEESRSGGGHEHDSGGQSRSAPAPSLSRGMSR